MRGTKKQSSRRLRKALLAVSIAGFAGLAVGATGCRVAEQDVKRWETTQRGPYKLVAVVTHDKYAWDLRAEAAMSLIRMPPRGGVRQGIGFLIDKYKDEDGQSREGALNQIPEQARTQLVDRMAPMLIEALDATPPAHMPDGRVPPDPSIPIKDATFAMLTHEPPLVSNEKTRNDLRAALIHWAQTDFEDRIENGTQQYGLEQMMRWLGPESVKTLPGIINENASRLDRIAGLVNDVGDDATKLKASEALVQLANRYASQDWLDAQKKLVQESNAKNNIKADDKAVAGQIDKIQERRLTEELFPAMKKVGGRPVIDYLFQFAANAKLPGDRRKLALAALEGRVNKNSTTDLDRIFAIAKDDATPDEVRDIAFTRLGEFPKELIVPKLYTVFNDPKWKVRWVAASLVLKTMSTKQVPEFMGHLPKTSGVKMAMTEPLSYGELIRGMDPAAGDPKPRDVIRPYLASKEFGPKMTALGFFWNGSKADRSLVSGLESDKTELPKCAPEDQCSWSCDVPKAGAKDPSETEPKELKTVGEFVTFCLVPSMKL